jgi:myo-inositol-1(or 4)-monophosphatase
MQPNDFRGFLDELLAQSGAIIRAAWGDAGHIAFESKSDRSPVTEVDRGVEKKLRELINAKFPAHGIIAEEFGSERENAEWVWVIDPIDGTKSFITGVPLFVTLIGLLHRGKPVLGAIDQPILRERCVGDNTTTLFNGKPTRVRPCSDLKNAVVTTSGMETIAGQPFEKGFSRLAAASRFTRTWGDGYGYLLLATGRVDVMAEPILAPWDLLPLIAVVNGAGGKITDVNGNEAIGGSGAIAACPELHPKVVQQFRG